MNTLAKISFISSQNEMCMETIVNIASSEATTDIGIRGYATGVIVNSGPNQWMN